MLSATELSVDDRQNEVIRTLQVESESSDTCLMYEYFTDHCAADIELSHTDSVSMACELLMKESFDVVLLDLNLPNRAGLEALHTILQSAPDIAVVIISDIDSETFAIQTLKAGGQDYIVKGQFDHYSLNKTIRYAHERKKIKDRLTYLAQYDPLTKLLNRESFLSRMSEAVDRSIRNENTLAVFFIDLDDFKQVNDTYGHAMGDELLTQVAERFTLSIRREDTIARLAGDEFAILVESVNSTESSNVVSEKLFELMEIPFQLPSGELYISLSVGITLFNGKKVSIENALKQADAAMYRAKKESGNTYHYYDDELEKKLKLRNLLKENVLLAIQNEQLFIEYQPQIDKENRLIGVESLLRWDIPKLGVIYPASFIPFLEDTGSIVPCGEWALRKSCQQVKSWYDSGVVPADFILNVNISAKQVRCSDFFTTVKTIVAETGFPVENLVLEITEVTLMEEHKWSIDTLKKLVELGVSITIDDFGLGRSSLSYLATFPFSTMKVDRSFMAQFPQDHDTVVLIKTLIGLAKSLDKQLIVEGVESQLQRDLLLELGCEKFQGFLFSKPQPIDHIQDIFKHFEPDIPRNKVVHLPSC